jgi:hypothetical protein
MTFTEFLTKYLGTRLDFDLVFGYQCVDVAKAYANMVWEVPVRAVGYSGGAKDIMKPNSMMPDSEVQRIPNTPTGVPPQGAIIIFDAASANPHGHVGICVSADLNTVTILEQNGGKGSGTGTGADVIRQRTYKYTANTAGVGKVLGWVIPKNGNLTGTPPTDPLLVGIPDEYLNAYNNGDARWLLGSLKDRDNEIKYYKTNWEPK